MDTSDIPITMTATGNYNYPLGIGTYKAEVIPVVEDVLTGEGTYTALNLSQNNLETSFNKAPIYTRSAVTFNVTPSGATAVSLPCVTDFALLLIDLGGTYTEASLARPELHMMRDVSFLSSHSLAGNEQATFSDIQNVGGRYWLSPDGGMLDDIVTLTPGSSEAHALWYIDTTVKLYYMYKIPGSSNSISLPLGNGTNGNYTQASASYLAFGIISNSGQLYPVIWLKDYYNSKTWIANTTLRVSFSGGGNFTVTQNDWFNTIITN